ncbi:MAG: hypothetical protein R3Y16_08190 [Rikenellaceae bacterium]
MNKLKIFFKYAIPLMPALLVVLLLAGVWIYAQTHNMDLSETFEVINIITTIFLSFVLIIVTMQIGERQLELQRNAQRINLFDRYAAIHEALISDISDFRLYEYMVLFDIQTYDINKDLGGKLHSILPHSKLLLSEDECKTLYLIDAHINEIRLLLRIAVDKLKAMPRSEYDKISVMKDTRIDLASVVKVGETDYSDRFYGVLREYKLLNEDGINQIIKSKNAINKIYSETNIEQVIEDYCNINNILKH